VPNKDNYIFSIHFNYPLPNLSYQSNLNFPLHHQPISLPYQYISSREAYNRTFLQDYSGVLTDQYGWWRVIFI